MMIIARNKVSDIDASDHVSNDGEERLNNEH
jgi:hypothetical protein